MRLFHINLNRLAALSAALCVIATILWVVSYHLEWHFTFYTASSRYVIRIKDGSVGWYGPRRDGSLNAVEQHLVANMSNDDFVWEKPNQVINGWFVKGNAKPGSATAQLYERCASSIREYPAMAPYPATGGDVEACTKIENRSSRPVPDVRIRSACDA